MVVGGDGAEGRGRGLGRLWNMRRQREEGVGGVEGGIDGAQAKEREGGAAGRRVRARDRCAESSGEHVVAPPTFMYSRSSSRHVLRGGSVCVCGSGW